MPFLIFLNNLIIFLSSPNCELLKKKFKISYVNIVVKKGLFLKQDISLTILEFLEFDDDIYYYQACTITFY